MKAKKDNFVIGLDYGTDSVRAIIVDASNGKQLSSAVHNYKRWAAGKYCDPAKNCFRQHPLDYIEGLEATVKTAIREAGGKTVAEKIRGISVDTTGSTPVAVDKNGTPLSLLNEFKDNPNAMFVLWKDHTAIAEAAEINELSHSGLFEDFTKYCGGIYSSEWFWAKIMHITRKDRKVANAAFSWVEHCDWLPAMLTGSTDPLKIPRSRCAAGHKAMWHKNFLGLPSEEFIEALEPKLKGLRSRLYTETVTADKAVGAISKEWAQRLGIPEDVIVGSGAFDAHMGAVGAQIEPYVLCKVVGTSTCDMLVVPPEHFENKLIKGICGQVDGSIIPGMLGLEAGQSAFGDVYAWFRNIIAWPLKNILSDMKIKDSAKDIDNVFHKILPELNKAAEKLPPSETGLVALDWVNGRRTPDANQELKAAICGISMGTDAPAIFRALVEATAFGARAIKERFKSEGIEIKGVVASGGIPKKSPFVMQTLADVLNCRIRVVRSEQACALGAAMFASVAAGIHHNVETAQKAMGQGFEHEYKPIAKNVRIYNQLYSDYLKLGKFAETWREE